jgi:hypothetical protein
MKVRASENRQKKEASLLDHFVGAVLIFGALNENWWCRIISERIIKDSGSAHRSRTGSRHWCDSSPTAPRRIAQLLYERAA